MDQLKNIDDVKSGECLAKDIYWDHILLCAKGTVLTSTKIEFLKNYGVSEIAIEMIKLHYGIDETRTVAKEMVSAIMGKKEIDTKLELLRKYKDHLNTYSHSIEVAILSTMIGLNMSFSREQLENLAISSILHDIGKQGISNKIINKKGHLTDEELKQIQLHPTLGYYIASDYYGVDSEICEGILHHHENLNGTGYPDGQKRGEISLFSRIIHCTDVYDALTRLRPYKPSYLPSEAYENLMGDTGIDREIVKVMLKSVPAYPIGTSVTLSSGQTGIVLKNNEHFPYRPVLKIGGQCYNLTSRENYHLVICGYTKTKTYKVV